MIATDYGLDFYRIYDALTRDYPRMAGLPKSGFAAGPCLFKDTMQLAAANNNNFSLGHAAMLINEGLPNFVVRHFKSRYPVSRMTIGILGMAFKANSDDHRESLSYKLRKILEYEAGGVLCTDVHVSDPRFRPLSEVVERSDLLILAAPHREYRIARMFPNRNLSLTSGTFTGKERASREDSGHRLGRVHRRLPRRGTARRRLRSGRARQLLEIRPYRTFATTRTRTTAGTGATPRTPSLLPACWPTATISWPRRRSSAGSRCSTNCAYDLLAENERITAAAFDAAIRRTGRPSAEDHHHLVVDGLRKRQRFPDARRGTAALPAAAVHIRVPEAGDRVLLPGGSRAIRAALHDLAGRSTVSVSARSAP